jgi:tocopherol O-methyltransferase
VILPRAPHEAPSVGAHYDVLDEAYRTVWGEHVHHGLWRTGAETPAQATRALLDLVADRARIGSGSHVCDVGCGYGASARALAEGRGAAVTGLTVSAAQHAHAHAHARKASGPSRVECLLRDWLENDLPSESFDAVIAIESISHMEDKARAFAECARVLRPGGRVAVCDWLAAESPPRWQERALLEPICRECRLPGLASESEYRGYAAAAGLTVEGFDDLSRRVGRTWWICLRRLGRHLARDPAARRLALGSGNPDRAFALSMVRIPVAYRVGAMRLGVLTAVK